MSISVFDLQPGDRVILNCPKAKRQSKREAQFQGIRQRLGSEEFDFVVTGPETQQFQNDGLLWARFLFQTVSGPAQVVEYPGGGTIGGLPPFNGTTTLTAAFRVEQDGGLREEEGRRIFIEQRIRMGQG